MPALDVLGRSAALPPIDGDVDGWIGKLDTPVATWASGTTVRTGVLTVITGTLLTKAPPAGTATMAAAAWRLTRRRPRGGGFEFGIAAAEYIATATLPGDISSAAAQPTGPRLDDPGGGGM